MKLSIKGRMLLELIRDIIIAIALIVAITLFGVYIA